jgi:hypothetical protein
VDARCSSRADWWTELASWTDGDAALPSTLFTGITGACRLKLLTGGATRYPLLVPRVRLAVAQTRHGECDAIFAAGGECPLSTRARTASRDCCCGVSYTRHPNR